MGVNQMPFMTKKQMQAKIDEAIASMLTELNDIYKNKSSDEYKMHGDITKSNYYEDIERMVANLSTLKGYPSVESKDMHAMFNVLHRPVFKKMTSEYITKPTERNVSFTAIYTVGYRVLVGELSRIYASTEATDKGIIYKPDKHQRRDSLSKFIRAYSNDLEGKIDNYIRTNMKDSIMQESWAAIAAPIINVLTFIKSNELIEWGQVFASLFNIVFGTAQELNPISYIDDVLTNSYDKKVKEFDNVCSMYYATKEAYEEYMKIPPAQRQQKVESKYVKNMEKYNIRMKNLQAKLAHFDQRAAEESKDKINSIKTTDESGSKGTTPKKPTTTETTTTTDDDFDF
jgi:hypothetical protein